MEKLFDRSLKNISRIRVKVIKRGIKKIRIWNVEASAQDLGGGVK
jgi:hypothetical protein